MNISNSKKELARIISENGGWRDFAKFYAQDGSGEIWSYAGKPKYGKDVYGFTGDEIDVEIRTSTINNFHQTILSREEYFHLYPAPDAGGWIEWSGGACPVDDGVSVEVKRERFIEVVDNPEEINWVHYGTIGDIIAYRLHKPEQVKPEPAQVEEAKPTIEQLAADYRNAKDYADRKQQEADAAKADAEAKMVELVAAGKEIGLVLSVAEPEPEPEPESELVITDWRQLRYGDFIWVASEDVYIVEGEYEVLEIERVEYDGTRAIRVKRDGLRSYWIDIDNGWKFIRRP